MKHATLNIDETTNLIVAGLRAELRYAIRKRFEEAAQDLIEEAAKQAVDSVMARVASMHSTTDMKTHIHFRFDIKEAK